MYSTDLLYYLGTVALDPFPQTTRFTKVQCLTVSQYEIPLDRFAQQQHNQMVMITLLQPDPDAGPH